MIEIIARDTCPTCGGICAGRGFSCCNTCHGQRGVVTVLATFADAAELRATIVTALEDLHGIGEYGSEDEMDAVLAALGVSDEQA